MEGIESRDWSPGYWEAHTVSCQQYLADEANWQGIPLLNNVPFHDLVDQQLVRFQGMIQDMYDPEYFLEKFEVVDIATGNSSIRSGKYRDIVLSEDKEKLLEESRNNENGSRQTWYCISTPGLNKWTNSHNTKEQCSKRPSESQALKRSAPEGDVEHSPVEMENKRVCGARLGETRHQNNPQLEHQLNLPLADPDARACIVKVYDEKEAAYALNNVVDVIGFISLLPPVSCEGAEGDDTMDVEIQALNPPVSLVPRLHAVVIQRQRHCNPLLSRAVNTVDILASAEAVRASLHLVLSQLLLGDTLAAEYLICHLVSYIYSRTDMLALGQMSLNFSCVPVDQLYAAKLYSMLELLVPKSHFLPLTIERLNEEMFVPKKDYKTNRLLSGVLQLSDHTHLVLDETSLQPGQLQNNGVHNMSALESLVSLQSIPYEFQYYQLRFNYDIPVLILSEGKSLLPCSVVLPLKPEPSCMGILDETYKAALHYLHATLLDSIRRYLTAARFAQYDISPQLQKVIQDDFVALRQNKPSSASAEDLHVLMVLTRLLSLSMGQSSLTEATWKKALSMEQQRIQRLSV